MGLELIEHSEQVGKWHILPFDDVPLLMRKEKEKYKDNFEWSANQGPKTHKDFSQNYRSLIRGPLHSEGVENA